MVQKFSKVTNMSIRWSKTKLFFFENKKYEIEKYPKLGTFAWDCMAIWHLHRLYEIVWGWEPCLWENVCPFLFDCSISPYSMGLAYLESILGLERALRPKIHIWCSLNLTYPLKNHFKVLVPSPLCEWLTVGLLIIHISIRRFPVGLVNQPHYEALSNFRITTCKLKLRLLPQQWPKVDQGMGHPHKCFGTPNPMLHPNRSDGSVIYQLETQCQKGKLFPYQETSILRKSFP